MLYNIQEVDSVERAKHPIPHVYTTAHNAYHALCQEGTCQSILISGESGAGKTEASKYIMQVYFQSLYVTPLEFLFFCIVFGKY